MQRMWPSLLFEHFVGIQCPLVLSLDSYCLAGAGDRRREHWCLVVVLCPIGQVQATSERHRWVLMCRDRPMETAVFANL